MLVDGRMFGFTLRWTHREQLHARSVEQQLELVWFCEPFDVLVTVAHQANLNLVLAVHRKRVVDDRAAARTDRQPFDMAFLCQVGRHADRLAVR